MKKNSVMLSLLVLLAFLFQNCESNKDQSKTEFPKPEAIHGSKDPEENIQYAVIVEKIDSFQYNSAKAKSNNFENPPVKISNFDQAKNRLKGVVEFTEEDAYGEVQAIKKIHFRNGKEYGNPNEIDAYFFVAYYPEEDILLCEGGHTSDISFNLKNGKEAGNPDLIKTSPGKEFRLNGRFGGQECYTYFIQRKMNHEYEKIIQLDEEFEKLTKKWLCVIGESFWADEKTLFITEASNYTENGFDKQYFTIKITENKPVAKK